jgi:hypothetical protein
LPKKFKQNKAFTSVDFTLFVNEFILNYLGMKTVAGIPAAVISRTFPMNGNYGNPYVPQHGTPFVTWWTSLSPR